MLLFNILGLSLLASAAPTSTASECQQTTSPSGVKYAYYQGYAITGATAASTTSRNTSDACAQQCDYQAQFAGFPGGGPSCIAFTFYEGSQTCKTYNSGSFTADETALSGIRNRDCAPISRRGLPEK